MPRNETVTVVVHSGDAERVRSAFMLGNGYLSLGMSVTFFFTFEGLLFLRKKGGGFFRVPGKFLPAGGEARKEKTMRKHRFAGFEELLSSFVQLGGRIVADSMAMELMGIGERDLRDEVGSFSATGEFCKVSAESDMHYFV